MLPKKIDVYRCSYCPDDRACGLYNPDDPTLTATFGHDSSYDECNHNWPRELAEEVMRRYNEEDKK